MKGKLIFTLFDDESSSIRAFMRPDKSVYCTINNGEKIEGVPKIKAERGTTLNTTYHAPKAVYTGATVGGVTTGGVHYTKGGYEYRSSKSGKGIVNAKVGISDHTIERVEISDYMADIFKRDKAYHALVKGNKIACKNESDDANFTLKAAISSSGDYADKMNLLSYAFDQKKLDFYICERIATLLDRMATGAFPPSDEELYKEAVWLSESKTSGKLKEAIDLFTEISDYEDSVALAKKCREKYEEVLQKEKEQAILAREERSRRNKKKFKILGISVACIAIISVVALFAFNMIKNNNLYENGISLMNAGSYEAAITEFTKLDDFKDSKAQITECSYLLALELIKEGKNKEAITRLEALGDYKDSKTQIAKAKKEEKYLRAKAIIEKPGDHSSAYNIFTELNDYKNSKQYLAGFVERIVKCVEKVRSREENYYYDKEGYLVEKGDITYTYSKDRKTITYEYSTADLVNTWKKIAVEKYDEKNNIIFSSYLYDDKSGSKHTFRYEYNEDGTIAKEVDLSLSNTSDALFTEYTRIYTDYKNSLPHTIEETYNFDHLEKPIEHEYHIEYNESGKITYYDGVSYIYGWIYAPEANSKSEAITTLKPSTYYIQFGVRE